MKRFTGHTEPWGEFVDVKINAAELLEKEIKKKKRGRVWISGVCDPYQPLEKKYRLTGMCLEILVREKWPVTIQTRSPLILRDINLLKKAGELEAGFSITTADDKIRKLFEPNAPSVNLRLKALGELHSAGIRTYAMIAPLLPGAEKLVEELKGKADYILVDRMNYNHADRVYRKHGLEDKMTDEYFMRTAELIAVQCRKAKIECQVVF